MIKLPYALDALEPVISKTTMNYHYNKCVASALTVRHRARRFEGFSLKPAHGLSAQCEAVLNRPCPLPAAALPPWPL